MATPLLSDLLIEAPVNRHFAQLHRDPQDLADAVTLYLQTGLRRGNGVLVIAAPEQTDRLFNRLAASKLHPKALVSSGQLVQVDAAKIIEQCTTSGLPEWADFRSALSPVLSRLEPCGRGIRVYSELANALWEVGQTDAAIELEDLWNRMAGMQAFSLYCGFRMDTQREESYAAPLEELGRTHSDILGTPEDEQFGQALDRASKEIFGISLTQMTSVSRQHGAHRFPTGQRAMLWVKRNLPMSSAQIAKRARQYFRNGHTP